MSSMKHRLSSLVLCLIILVIIITAITLSADELNCSNENIEEKVFFAKWDSYMGCALYEEESQIQLPFLDGFLNYKQFAGEIKEVSLNFTYESVICMPTNLRELQNPIRLSGFSVIDGNEISEGQYCIRALQIPFDIEHEGIVKFDEITIIMSDGKTYTWQIGQWEIEIIRMLKSEDFEQGDCGFVIDPVPKYYFEMINRSLDVLRCDKLIYGKTIPNKLQIDKKQCEAQIESGYTSMVVYCEDVWEPSKGTFYYIKPFLQYYVGEEERLAPLKAIGFSGLLTEEAIKQILKNKGTRD